MLQANPTPCRQAAPSDATLAAHMKMYTSGVLELETKDGEQQEQAGEQQVQGGDDTRPTLVLMRNDATCDHIHSYISSHDASDMFDVLYYDDLTPEEVPPWLQGVPSIALETGRVLTSLQAVKFIRTLVSGCSDSSVRREAHSGMIVMSLGGRSGGGGSGISRSLALPESADSSIQDLLPLPLNPEDLQGGVGGNEESSLTPEQMKQKVEEQMQCFNQLWSNES